MLIGHFFLLSSCFDEEFTFESSTNLEFSVDTLRFDTVFTSVGSATRLIKVYNRSNENIIISSIGLVKEGNSMFRVNIDGFSADRVSDTKILANDSLYIFVEVTVDPDQPLSVSPFIISEELEFVISGRNQTVMLEAWGQNANYFPSRDAAGQIIGLSCNNSRLVWDDPRPYVIYGLLFIDSCELIIAPGTDLFFHGGLARVDDLIFNDGGMFFLSGARLRALGEHDAKITFQGDRLESNFDDIAGQWAGLRFLANSTGNELQHTKIINPIVGARVDSAAELSITSSEIYNTSNVGVIGVHATINIDNSIVHSNAGQSCLFASGGNYSIRHTTLANYENQSAALYMDNFTCLVSDCSEVLINPLNANIVNSIIAGSNDDEINFRDATGGEVPESFQVNLANVFLTVDEQKEMFNFAESCNPCIEDIGDPIFQDENEDNYQLDSASLALGQGVFLPDLPIDLAGRQRDNMSPDLGCYELEN